jgi:hypothetical protein
MWTGPKEAGEAAVRFSLRSLGSFAPLTRMEANDIAAYIGTLR